MDHSLLKELDLTNCKIGSDEINHLAQVLPKSNLEILNLSTNSIGNIEFTTILSSIPSILIDLRIYENQITTLKSLNLYGHPILKEKTLEQRENIKNQLELTMEQDGSYKLLY